MATRIIVTRNPRDTARRQNADASAARVWPILMDMRRRGLNLHQMAETLTTMGVLTPRGGDWTATAVKRVLARL